MLGFCQNWIFGQKIWLFRIVCYNMILIGTKIQTFTFFLAKTSFNIFRRENWNLRKVSFSDKYELLNQCAKKFTFYFGRKSLILVILARKLKHLQSLKGCLFRIKIDFQPSVQIVKFFLSIFVRKSATFCYPESHKKVFQLSNCGGCKNMIGWRTFERNVY